MTRLPKSKAVDSGVQIVADTVAEAETVYDFADEVSGDETGAFKPHRPISRKLKPKVLESDCKLFDGRIVLRQRTLEGGVCEPAYGRIRYLGNHCGPKPFECRYSDGTKERLSYHIIQDCVLPESTPNAGLNVPEV